MKNNNLIILIQNLLVHINSRRKTQFFFLLLLTICAGLTEMISIASVVPFVEIITKENFTNQNFFLSKFFTFKTKADAVIFSGLIFSFLYLLNALVRIFLIFVTARVSRMTTAEIAVKIFKSKINDTYANFIIKDSNNIISAVTQKVNQVTISLSSIISFISSSIIFICIMSALILINPKVMLIAFLFFGFLYFIFVFFGKNTVQKSSEIINNTQNNIVLNLQNGLGAIRDIILDKTQSFYLKFFSKESFTLARRESLVEFIQGSPRYIFESMGIILFVILLIYSSKSTHPSNEFSDIFPVLAALALGSQRILPLLNKMYTDFISVKSHFYQIKEVSDILDEQLILEKQDSLINKKEINLKKFITFKNVSFAYYKKRILENVNFEIKKGSRVGIIGKTGEGKSTFLDLLMGLLKPTQGSIYIDNNELSKETIDSWQTKISHVPQKIFLSNSTFLENIAFGKELEKIDLQLVEQSAKKSQIHEYIMSNHGRYKHNVGERGIKLSGGQIQRIGIARAFYKNPELIIFDEATNSLDNKTENLIMNEIYNSDKNLTLIIVAHRVDTLKNCDVIFEIKDKKIVKVEKTLLNLN